MNFCAFSSFDWEILFSTQLQRSKIFLRKPSTEIPIYSVLLTNYLRGWFKENCSWLKRQASSYWVICNFLTRCILYYFSRMTTLCVGFSHWSTCDCLSYPTLVFLAKQLSQQQFLIVLKNSIQLFEKRIQYNFNMPTTSDTYCVSCSTILNSLNIITAYIPTQKKHRTIQSLLVLFSCAVKNNNAKETDCI